MKSVEVEIFGGTYTIKGDSDPEHVRALARFLDEKMRAAARSSPSTIGAHKIAVLAALNIADELFSLRTRQKDVDNMIRRKTGDLFDLLGEG